MTSPTIYIDVNARRVDALLLRLDTAMSPLGIAQYMKVAVDPWIRRRVKERFDAEGDDAVGRWLPLSPETRIIRAAKGFQPDGPINVRTGELERFITQGAVERITPTSSGATYVYPGLGFGGELRTKYDTAQAGKKSPRTPPRPVVGIGERDLAHVLSSLSMWIQGKPQ